MIASPAEPRCVLDIKAILGEGPVWSAADGVLWFVDIPACRIHRFVPETADLRSWTAPGRVAFLFPLEAPDASVAFICGLSDGLWRFDPASGEFSGHRVVEPDLPENRLNDGAVDAQGRLWFGSMHDPEADASGAIFSLTPDGAASIQGPGPGRLVRHDEGYVVSNGPAVSPDGRTLYVSDSPQQVIYAFDIAPDGNLSGKRVFARLDQGYPDGLTVDSEGGLWCCVFGGKRAMRFAADGSVTDVVPMPATYVTKLALGGPDLRTAYATTAARDLTPQEAAREPQAGGVFAFRVKVAGIAQHAVRAAP